MKFKILIIPFILLGCGNQDKNQGKNMGTESMKVETGIQFSSVDSLIPQKVKDFLELNRKGWVFPDTTDYNKAWWSFYSKDQVPYYAVTDLNDDNKADYSMILKNEGKLRWIVLVSYGETFRQLVMDDFNDKYQGKDVIFGVGVEPPGRVDCVVNSKEQSLVLKSNGFVLMNFEFKIRIVYWEAGKLREFMVSDLLYI